MTDTKNQDLSWLEDLPIPTIDRVARENMRLREENSRLRAFITRLYQNVLQKKRHEHVVAPVETWQENDVWECEELDDTEPSEI